MGALKRCVIIGAGVISDFSLMRSFISNDDFIICADGGTRHALKMDLKPNAVIGDFDSGSADLPFDCVKITLNKEKDETDLFEAVAFAYERGFREILVLGCLGGRFDHSMANVAMLSFWRKKGAQITLSDEKNDITVLEKGAYRLSKKRRYVSFFPFGGEVRSLVLSGFKYPLGGTDIPADRGLCVSNEFLSDFADISFTSGELIVIFSED